jgi:hypothetical protein
VVECQEQLLGDTLELLEASGAQCEYIMKSSFINFSEFIYFMSIGVAIPSLQ